MHDWAEQAEKQAAVQLTLAFLSFLLIMSHRYLTTCSAAGGQGVIGG